MYLKFRSNLPGANELRELLQLQFVVLHAVSWRWFDCMILCHWESWCMIFQKPKGDLIQFSNYIFFMPHSHDISLSPYTTVESQCSLESDLCSGHWSDVIQSEISAETSTFNNTIFCKSSHKEPYFWWKTKCLKVSKNEELVRYVFSCCGHISSIDCWILHLWRKFSCFWFSQNCISVLDWT